MSEPGRSATTLREPLTESPWFWVLTFCFMSLLALVAISGKYGRRQANMEVEYQARERIAVRTDHNNGNKSPENNRTGDLAARRPFASPGNTLVPIWPLAAILVLVALFALVMLYRARNCSSPPADESPPP